MHVRLATYNDLRPLETMWLALNEEHVKLNPDEWALTDNAHDCLSRYLTQFIAEQGHIILVAEHNGKLVGYLMAEMDRNDPMFRMQWIGTITELYVNPSARKKGAGKALLAAAMDELKGLGAELVKLYVEDSNDAKAFYEKAGFKVQRVRMQRKP